MKQLTRIALLVQFLFVSVFLKAESETVIQDFTTLRSPSEIEFTNSNKTATTAFTTYNCFRTGEFAIVSGAVRLTLPAVNDSVKTARINELKRIKIFCYPVSSTPTNLKVYLSKDGVDFGDALPRTDSSYPSGSGLIDLSFPRGNYYVKIVNDKSKNGTSISTIYFYLDHCNCFEYVP